MRGNFLARLIFEGNYFLCYTLKKVLVALSADQSLNFVFPLGNIVLRPQEGVFQEGHTQEKSCPKNG